MKLSYLQQGFGSSLPLVLLHPYPLNSHFWKYQLAAFSRQRHVIAPNFRGYGASNIDRISEFTVEMFAEDIRKTMNSLQIPKAIFAGCSIGGYVMFEMWRQFPEMIEAMAFIDTRAEPDNDEARAKRKDQIDKVRQVGPVDIPDFAGGLLSPDIRKNNPALERDVRSMAAEPAKDVIINTLELLVNRPDSVPTLATIDVPCLIMVGEDDTATPLPHSQLMHDGIKESCLVTIPNAGHYSPLENPDAANRALSEFLNQITEPN